MKFSVIIPLYNKAPYVRKALGSVFAQSYSDYEVIIVDDGSTDNSLQMAEESIRELQKAKKQLQVRIIKQSNAGVAAARNNGVEVSKGDYLCFLDADDWWESDFLCEMERLISLYPDAGLYGTNYIYYKPGKTHTALDIPMGYINYPKVYYATGAMPVWTGAACMPRSVYDEMGGFPIGIKLGEDFLLWAKTALHYPVAFSDKPLAYYNNDVPSSLRATRNLHAPQHHMIFNMRSIETAITQLTNDEQRHIWHALVDKLRLNGLHEYWLSKEYHATAEKELAKIDWTRQPSNEKRRYRIPLWMLRSYCCFMQIGSYCKQRILKLRQK